MVWGCPQFANSNTLCKNDWLHNASTALKYFGEDPQDTMQAMNGTSPDDTRKKA